MMKNLDAVEFALAPVGFNMKTKALYSLVRGNLKGYNRLKDTLLSLGENPATVDVWATMLLNYHLNGSYPNLGKFGIWHRVASLSADGSYSLGARSVAYNHFKSTVRPKTYERWATALRLIQAVA